MNVTTRNSIFVGYRYLCNGMPQWTQNRDDRMRVQTFTVHYPTRDVSALPNSERSTMATARGGICRETTAKSADRYWFSQSLRRDGTKTCLRKPCAKIKMQLPTPFLQRCLPTTPRCWPSSSSTSSPPSLSSSPTNGSSTTHQFRCSSSSRSSSSPPSSSSSLTRSPSSQSQSLACLL